MTTRLLKLCGFNDKELREEEPRIQRAFDKLGVTPKDIDIALERIATYYGTDLQGMLRAIGVAIRELADTMLAAEDGKKIIYASLPNAATDILGAVSYHSGGKVHTAFPDVLVLQVMGCLFNKLDRILEAAEKSYLRAGAAECSLLQTRVGLYILGLIPRGDLLLSMGFLCDALCKSDEMLQELYGIPVVYIDSQQDHGKNWDDIFRGVDYFAEEIRECKRKVGELVGFEITDEMVLASRSFRRESALTAMKVAELVMDTDPPPFNAASLMFVRLLRAQPISEKNMPKLTEAIRLLYQELKERVRQGYGVVPKGAPRIFYGPLVSTSDPSITDMIEKLGIAVALTEDSIFQPDGSTSPRVEPIGAGKDPWERAAYQILQRSIQACLPMRLSAIKGALRRGKFDGGIELYHYACRYFAGDPKMIKDAMQREFDVPFLVLEGDLYDPRYYTAEQLRTRIESFAEMLKARKAAAQV
jgi:benzoyl-CoA reductase/2-hydroxyglutaryl-CoA dehydratase subunit BcrC/BadD/HgdB